MHIFKLLGAFFKVNIQMTLAYRTDTLVNILLSILSLGWELLGLSIIFNNTTRLGDWGLGELIALLGVFHLVNALMQILIWPNTEKFNASVRDGTLDYTFLLPASSMFLVTFSRMVIWRAWDLVLAVVLIVIGIALLVDLMRGPSRKERIRAAILCILAATPMVVWLILARPTTDNPNTSYLWIFTDWKDRNGLAFGVNYTYSISYKGNLYLQKRLQHAPDGTISVRADQKDYEKLMENLDRRPHIIKANAVWDLPNAPSSFAKAVAYVLNDWQISGVLTAGSGPAYDLGYSFRNNGASVNMTGSPDYGARIVYVGDPGVGCSSNQFLQFNPAAVTAPTYASVGLESGRNILRGCADHTVDLAVLRSIRLGGSRRVQFRLDAFNAFNTVIISGRSTGIQYNSPTDLTILNSETLSDGSIDPARRTPRTAGFGAATGALPMRSLQFQVRFQF